MDLFLWKALQFSWKVCGFCEKHKQLIQHRSIILDLVFHREQREGQLGISLFSGIWWCTCFMVCMRCICVYVVNVCVHGAKFNMCLVVHVTHMYVFGACMCTWCINWHMYLVVHVVCMWCMYVYMVHKFTHVFSGTCGVYVFVAFEVLFMKSAWKLHTFHKNCTLFMKTACFSWKPPPFERPLARNCNPMFTNVVVTTNLGCLNLYLCMEPNLKAFKCNVLVSVNHKSELKVQDFSIIGEFKYLPSVPILMQEIFQIFLFC